MRPRYDHNPEYVLVRATHTEMGQLGDIFARKLSAATGPVQVLVPTEGLSIPNMPGGVFWDPLADRHFLDRLRAGLPAHIPVHTLAAHVNDPAFGIAAADLFIEMTTQT